MTRSVTDKGLPLDVTGWDRLRQPIWLFDPVSFRGLYANAAALELWGAATLEELLARDFSQLSPAVRARTDRLAMATAEGGTRVEHWTFYPNGKPVTVQAMISSMRLAYGGSALLFEASPVEVEEDERRATEALRHTSSLITLFDADARAVFTNPAAFAVYGGGDRTFLERFADPGQGDRVLASALAGEVVAELCQVLTVEGERWHHLDARQVTDPVTGITDVLLSERDVTSQVEAERAARAADERAEVAEAKQRFLANMSHELRTPLTSVLGFAGLLGASGLNDEQQRHVGRISQAGDALLGVINDVIALSELDCGEVTLAAAPFDAAVVLTDALVSVQTNAAAKGLELFLEIEGDASTHVIGDRERVKTVVAHYLTNAVKFTERGEITLKLEAHEAVDGVVALEISVSDSGPGLAAAQQETLFQRFGQGDSSMRKRFGGAGLGLAISQELATLMGGEVGVQSTPGVGSRFWLRLSLPGAQTSTQTRGAAEARPLLVLYADDHENNRVLVQAMLATQGHRCDVARDGREAVSAVQGGDYDLILMDIQMPVLDGVGAAAAIRALPGPEAATPILALTANTLSEQLATYQAVGMNDCIAKPVNMAELLDKTAAWAATEWRRQERDAA